MLTRIWTLILLFSVSSKALCPENYDAVGSGCLQIPDSQLTFVEAQDLCHDLHGQLAILSNCQSFSEAVHYVENATGTEESFWIGATYSVSTGEWQWRDGSTVAQGIPYWGQSSGGSSEPYGGTCPAYCLNGNFYFGAFGCSSANSPLCTAPPSPDGLCNLPFLAVGSQCVYFARSTENSWDACRDFCQDEGGDLVVFETCQQYIDVSNYIQEQGLMPDVAYWVGGSIDTVTEEWFWIDGAPIPLGVPLWGQYPNSPLLPNNATVERCLELGSPYRHRFNDLGCMELIRPLCMATPI